MKTVELYARVRRAVLVATNYTESNSIANPTPPGLPNLCFQYRMPVSNVTLEHNLFDGWPITAIRAYRKT